jgi:hypothetical protein
MAMRMYAAHSFNLVQSGLLQIGNAGACARWIKELPLADEPTAHHALAGQIAALRTATITAHERLRILETLRETVELLQAVVAKRYVGKALPLEKNDADTWQLVVSVWWELGANYQRCLEAHREGDALIAPFASLVIMRCLHVLECILFEHYRSYHQPDPTIWREFHELFSAAETRGVLNIRVPGLLDGQDANPSCAEAYTQGLLLALADPYSLSARQLGFVRRWIEKWAPLVELSRQRPQIGAMPSLAVDLAGNCAATLAERIPPSSSVRYLDMEQLSRLLRQTLNQLKQGNTPGQLGLGEDARQPGCEGLIMLLFVQWCRGGLMRKEARRAADHLATMGFGLGDAWTLVSTNLPPETSSIAHSKEAQELLDNLLSQSQTILQAATDIFEKWRILDQSASGFKCAMRDPTSMTRILHNQLFAVQFTTGKSYLIGMVQWLRVDKREGILCGVRLFPGEPQVVMVRMSNFKLADQQKFEQAMLLPEIATPATPSTIVLPAGWFENGRVIEFKDGPKQFARLHNLLERGSDFDRGTFDYI